MTFGEQIAEARRAQKMTQSALAELLGVSPETVSKWERDTYLPSPERLPALYQVLKLPYLENEEAEALYNEQHMSAFIKGRISGRDFPETQKALPFAKQAHAGQFRKGSGKVPYINHPLTMVCHALAMGIEDDVLLAALLLHDVPEDCGTAPDTLPVSEPVREIVRLVTKTGKSPKAYYAGIAKNPIACLVKCIDRCNNLSSMALGFEQEKIREYVHETEAYYPPLLQMLKGTPAYNNASWLLDYQIRALLRTAKRISSST